MSGGVAITRRGRHVKPVVSYKEASSSSSSSSEEEEEEEEAIDPEYDPTFPTPELNAKWEALRHTNALAALIALLKDSPLDSPFSTEYARLLRAWQEAGYEARAPVLTRPSRTVRAQWPARRRAFWARVASWLVVREQRGELTYEDRAGKAQEEPPSAMDVYPDEGTPELPYPANLPEVVDEQDESDLLTLADMKAIWEDDTAAADKKGLDAAFQWLMSGYEGMDPDTFQPELKQHYENIKRYAELHREDPNGLTGFHGMASYEDYQMVRRMVRVLELIYPKGVIDRDADFAELKKAWEDMPPLQQPTKKAADRGPTKRRTWDDYFRNWVQNPPTGKYLRDDRTKLKNGIDNIVDAIKRPSNQFVEPAKLIATPGLTGYARLVELLRRVNAAKGFGWVFPDEANPYAPLPMEPAPAQPKEDEQHEAEPMETSPMPKTQAAPGTPLAPLVEADEAQLRNLEERQAQVKALLDEVRNYLKKNHARALAMAEDGDDFGQETLARSRLRLDTYRDRWRALTQGTILDFEHEWETPAAIELRTMEEQIERLKRKIEQEKAHLDAPTAALNGASLLAVAREWRNIQDYTPEHPRVFYWRNIITEFRERRAAMRKLLAEEEAIRARVAANKAELVTFLDKVHTSQGQADQVERDLEIAGMQAAEAEKKRVHFPDEPQPVPVPAVEKKRAREPKPPAAAKEPEPEEDNPLSDVFMDSVLEAMEKWQKILLYEDHINEEAVINETYIVEKLVPALRKYYGRIFANKGMRNVSKDEVMDLAGVATIFEDIRKTQPSLYKRLMTFTIGDYAADVSIEGFLEELAKAWNRKLQKGGAKGGKSAPKIRVQQELK